MLRVTSGRLKGLNLQGPGKRGKFRPTEEKVREALFSMIEARKRGSFLDLYAGSGAVGLEALSRGHHPVFFVEQSPKHFKILKQNTSLISSKNPEMDQAMGLSRSSALAFLSKHREAFDIVFCDPPYAKVDKELVIALLQRVQVKPEGLLILEHHRKWSSPDELPASWRYQGRRDYGNSSLSFYEKTSKAR